MDKPPKSVGRSRGRAQNSQNSQNPVYEKGRGSRRQMQSGPQQQVVTTAQNPNVQAWGAKTGAVPRDKTAPVSTSTIFASQQRMPPAILQERGTSSTQVVKDDNRGAVRGKRVITEIIRSRPRTCISKAGTIGFKVTVEANYFLIKKKPEWSIGQYRVDFSPDVDQVSVRRAYLAQHKHLLGGYIFDGTLLFTCTNLKEQMLDGILELLTKNREGETIQIKIRHVGNVSATDATQVHVLNLILRRSMEGLNLQQLSRNFFDPKAKICIDSFNLEIWPGYQTSIRQHEQNILLCVEITHKVLRTDSVYRILTTCIRDSKDYQTAFKSEVIGMVVITDYNNKTYRVDDVDFNTNPLSKFNQKDTETSYIEYYKKRYNLQIRDPKQPMLVSRPTEKNIRGGNDNFILLIPELCRATGITDAMRNNFRLMKAMSEHTRLRPELRIERLRAFNRRLKQAADSMQVLKSWNMELDTHLVQIPGRVLPPELIVFGSQRRYTCDERADWTHEFKKNSMYHHKDLKRWCVVTPRRNIKEVNEFIKLCIKAALGMKMYIGEPRYVEMPDDRTGSYSQAIENAASMDPQLIMLALVSQNEEKYSCIKKKCCIDRPIPSQVVTLRTIAPRGDKAGGLMSIATKVVIQMNTKVMGAPWMIQMPVSGLMTVGFDVCHSAKEKNMSYGALVATMDLKQCAKYFSNVTKHLKGQELSNEISMSMTFALKAYRQNHGALPERIMFFRDGVGDGQLHQVIKTEVEYLKQKLGEIYSSAGITAGPKFCFIIVSKCINTRYFVKNQNPIPGTVVDDIITLPERYDFFLVSQSVRQGTVSPTSYNVIHDTMGFSADKIQMLTYKMTHLYYNWSGTCRVPAVCQYAHKLAFLVSESIHRAPSNALENQLYFL